MSLLAAVAVLFFSTGRWIIPIAAWLSPLFLLRFVRTRRALPGLVVAALVSIGVPFIIWRGMIPAPGALYYAIVAVLAAISMLPYVADRLIAPRFSGFKSTLVFPCAWAAFEYLHGREPLRKLGRHGV